MSRQKTINPEQMKTLEASGLLREIPKSRYLTVSQDINIKVKTYAEEEIIFSEGETVKGIAILHSGTIRGEKFHLEGNVDLMHMYQRGEIFGAEAAVSRLRTSPLTYIANEESVVLSADFADIRQGRYAAEMILALLHILADDNIKMLYKIETLSKRGLRDRIMTYLQNIGKKADSETYSIHMDREQFAQYLCVNRSALSYELNQMKRDGLIDFKKDEFTIIKNKK